MPLCYDCLFVDSSSSHLVGYKLESLLSQEAASSQENPLKRIATRAASQLAKQ